MTPSVHCSIRNSCGLLGLSLLLVLPYAHAAKSAAEKVAEPVTPPFHALPDARDFNADAAESRAQKMPILVFFTAADCPYCAIVREDYLEPMFSRGTYRRQILFRVVHVDSDDRLRDFSGRESSHADFAQAQGARLTPNIKLYDANGRELVPGLLGLSTRDFFAGYLEQAIADAVIKLRGVSAPVK